jgi:tetratricopeptide (TPR) repeat protein
MRSAGDLERLLATAVCGVSVGGATVSGTGWLVAPEGIVLTAGHMVVGAPSVQVAFPGKPPLPAQVVIAEHEPARGIDFAILEVEPPGALAALPIALTRSPRGPLMSSGYGLTLRSLSAAAGEIIGPFDPQNDSAFRLFRCRSQELAEQGYSGAPIVSVESGAVVGVQIEAVTGSRGARDTVLAMPLYRIAQAWNRLEEIEADQARGQDRQPGWSIMLVAADGDNLAGRIGNRLAERGFDVTPVTVAPGRVLQTGQADLADVAAVLIVTSGIGDFVLDGTRDLVVGTIVRQLPLIVATASAADLPSYLHGFPRVDSEAAAVVEDAAATVSAAATDAANPGALADALEDIQSSAADPVRFQPRIDELRSIMGGWSSRRERQDRRIRVLSEGPEAVPQSGTLAPAVGVRPFDPQHLFRDRVHEAEEISRSLADEAIGIVSIVGRTGMGKTALAARVMNALRAQRWFHSGARKVIDGLVFLSTRTSSGISSDEIILKIAQLTGDAGLFRTWSTRTIPLSRRIAAVLEALGERRVVVLLDNFEELLDDSGRISGGDELNALLVELVLADSPVSFLITSRERVEFPPQVLPRTRVVELRTGLPVEESIQMLRELDPQSEYGLAVSSDAELRSLAEAVHGIPRALQLIAGLLANDPLLTVGELVALDMPAVDESLSGIIAETLSRLDQSARWILLALAVVGRPVPVPAADFILRPFAPGMDVPSLLRRLVRTQIVSVDRITRCVALHPADRRYLLRQAAEQREATLALLHRRTADYYLSIAKAAADLHDIDDVRPLLFAVEHFLRCEHAHQAAEILDAIGGLLENAGQYHLTIELSLSLAGIATGDDWVRNAMRLGRLYWLTGEPAIAADWLARSEAAATSAGDVSRLPAILVDLAASQRDSGGLPASLRTFRRALRIANENGDGESLVVARALVQSTHTLRPLGFLAASLSCADRAIRLTEGRAEHDAAAAFLQSGALINAAISDNLAGDLELAGKKAGEAQRIARGIGDRGLDAYAGCVLAGVARLAGSPDGAVADLLAALETYEEIGDRWGLAACLATLSWALTDLLDVDAATTNIQRGRSAADGCNPRAQASLTLAESVLARRTGDFATAARLAAEAVALFDAGAFDVYGAWARCELATVQFLQGEDVRAAGALFVRATPITKATWEVLALLRTLTDGPRADIVAAVEYATRALSRARAPGRPNAAWTVLAGQLTVIKGCLGGEVAMTDVAQVFEAFPAAPGILRDHRSILDRLAVAGLPGSADLRRALAGF